MKRIHVVREAGGLGDVIRIFAFLDGLREKYPGTPVTYYGPELYRTLVMDGHCWGMDREGCEYMATDGERLREYRGASLDLRWGTGIGRSEVKPKATAQLRLAVAYRDSEPIYDLYCPASAHEQETGGAPTKERTNLFRVDPTVPEMVPRFHLNEDECHRLLPASRYVILHPHAEGSLRNWPMEHWRRLGEMLAESGFQPAWTGKSMCELRGLVGIRTTDLAWGTLARNLAEVRLVIGVDSGIFHLAAAVRQGDQAFFAVKTVLGIFGATDGELISSVYPNADYIQAPRIWKCKGQCYGFNARGFCGEGCENGCRNMRAVKPEDVYERVLEMMEGGNDGKDN